MSHHRLRSGPLRRTTILPTASPIGTPRCPACHPSPPAHLREGLDARPPLSAFRRTAAHWEQTKGRGGRAHDGRISPPAIWCRHHLAVSPDSRGDPSRPGIGLLPLLSRPALGSVGGNSPRPVVAERRDAPRQGAGCCSSRCMATGPPLPGRNGTWDGTTPDPRLPARRLFAHGIPPVHSGCATLVACRGYRPLHRGGVLRPLCSLAADSVADGRVRAVGARHGGAGLPAVPGDRIRGGHDSGEPLLLLGGGHRGDPGRRAPRPRSHCRHRPAHPRDLRPECHLRHHHARRDLLRGHVRGFHHVHPHQRTRRDSFGHDLHRRVSDGQEGPGRTGTSHLRHRFLRRGRPGHPRAGVPGAAPGRSGAGIRTAGVLLADGLRLRCPEQRDRRLADQIAHDGRGGTHHRDHRPRSGHRGIPASHSARCRSWAASSSWPWPSACSASARSW